MIQADPQVALGVDLARQFTTMVRHRLEDKLEGWLEMVKNSGLPALIDLNEHSRNRMCGGALRHQRAMFAVELNRGGLHHIRVLPQARIP